MENLILAAIVLVILAAAIWSITRLKKKGVKCVGCPAASQCAGNQQRCASRGGAKK